MTAPRRIRLTLVLAVIGLVLSACRDSPRGSKSIDLMTIVGRAEVRPSRDAVQATIVTVGGVSRRVLTATGAARVTWTLRIPARTSLHASVAVVPASGMESGSAAVFRVGIADDRIYEELMMRRVAPGEAAGDRSWIPIEVDLGRYGGFQWSLFYRPGSRIWKLILNSRHDRTRNGGVGGADDSGWMMDGLTVCGLQSAVYGAFSTLAQSFDRIPGPHLDAAAASRRGDDPGDARHRWRTRCTPAPSRVEAVASPGAVRRDDGGGHHGRCHAP